MVRESGFHKSVQRVTYTGGIITNGYSHCQVEVVDIPTLILCGVISILLICTSL
jgi:hypothetical protein